MTNKNSSEKYHWFGQGGIFAWWEAGLLAVALAVSWWLYASGVDADIHLWAMRVFPPGWPQEMWGLFSRLGQGGVQLAICAVIAVWYYWRCRYDMSRLWWSSIPIFIVVGLSNYPLKVLFGRPRPKLLESMYEMQWWEMPARLHAYPSGHTVTTFCLLAVVMSAYTKPVQGALLVLASVTAFGRVGLGSHYMGDVVAGAVLGYVGGRWLAHHYGLVKSVPKA